MGGITNHEISERPSVQTFHDGSDFDFQRFARRSPTTSKWSAARSRQHQNQPGRSEPRRHDRRSSEDEPGRSPNVAADSQRHRERQNAFDVLAQHQDYYPGRKSDVEGAGAFR